MRAPNIPNLLADFPEEVFDCVNCGSWQNYYCRFLSLPGSRNEHSAILHNQVIYVSARVGTREFRFEHSDSEFTTETFSSVKTVTIRVPPPPEIQLAEEREPIAPEQEPDQDEPPPPSLQSTRASVEITLFPLVLLRSL